MCIRDRRYENGSIDNTKKMVLEGLSEALHVSIEWLKGETDEYETDITDKKELQTVSYTHLDVYKRQVWGLSCYPIKIL